MYTHNYYKKFLLFYKKIYKYIKKSSSPHNYKIFFCLLNIKITQNNNMSFENDDKSIMINT